MTSTDMNKKHFRFGGDFEIFSMNNIHRMQIIVLKNDSKGLILETDTEKLYSILELGDPPRRVHPSCHLYLLSYYGPVNPSYTNMLNHYMYLAVQDRKRCKSI